MISALLTFLLADLVLAQTHLHPVARGHRGSGDVVVYHHNRRLFGGGLVRLRLLRVSDTVWGGTSVVGSGGSVVGSVHVRCSGRGSGVAVRRE